MPQIERNEIRCYRSPKIEVRNSDLEGRGVFAVKKIEKDDVVLNQKQADTSPLCREAQFSNYEKRNSYDHR